VSETEVTPEIRTRVKSEIENKVKAITDAGDPDMADIASGPLREYLRR
jgi:hypothetical protein